MGGAVSQKNYRTRKIDRGICYHSGCWILAAEGRTSCSSHLAEGSRRQRKPIRRTDGTNVPIREEAA